MNSKECLENIKHAPGFMGGNSRYKSALESRIPFLEDIEIIKQNLNRLEKLEKENQELKNTILSLEIDTCIPELRKENLKLKKFIEILKNKRVDIFELKFSFSVNEYNIVVNDTDYDKLTQEEYELLKEVLENE